MRTDHLTFRQRVQLAAYRTAVRACGATPDCVVLIAVLGAVVFGPEVRFAFGMQTADLLGGIAPADARSTAT